MLTKGQPRNTQVADSNNVRVAVSAFVWMQLNAVQQGYIVRFTAASSGAAQVK